MSQRLQDGVVEARRVAIACQRCRRSKLKCTGTLPCERCQKRSYDCVFDDNDADSRLRASVATSSTPRKRARLQEADTVSQRPIIHHSGQHPSASTLTTKAASGHSSYLKNRPANKKRKWLYLGASSTWSFNVRVASIIQACLRDRDMHCDFQFSLEGDAHTIRWDHINSGQDLDLSRLPSYDYAVYLINTVKYHLGGMFHIFDEETFMDSLQEFYKEASESQNVDRLWYTQYLTLLAFGKSLLHSNKSNDGPLGNDFFTRAMSVLPNPPDLYENPVLSVEVLSLVALYFLCLDMRQTAYSYVGHALRIALVEGLHTNLPVKQIGERLASRCNSLWWTVYILDRMLSATIGAPTSVNDDEITNLLPSPPECSTRLATLSLHVKLSRLVSVILTELYSANGSLESSYLAKTRSVLRDMAVIAEEMEQVIDLKFKSSIDTITRAATHLRLLYHQCIILATRPLLLCLLQDIIKSRLRNSRSTTKTSQTVRDLVHTCTNSAIKTLKIVKAIQNHNMLDTFLPFDLEYTCAANSVLIVVSNVLRFEEVPPSTRLLATKIIDEVVLSGNAVAQLRRKELEDLHCLATQLWKGQLISPDHQGEETESQTLNRMVPPRVPSRRTSDAYPPYESAQAGDALTRISTTSSQDLAQNFDLSHEHMLFLADQIDVDALEPGDDFDMNGDYHWLLTDFEN